jgi:ATP-binding cassette subfamily F protein uup
MSLISVYQLEKSFGAKTLFTGVSFGIKEKEHVGLVGPNGAGKSTLLKILLGTMESDSGHISRKRGLSIGYLEQTPSFDDDKTILDTILEKCADPHESIGKAYEIMTHLQLTQFSEALTVKQLSGGWQKRVALARELILEPELLLLDEPTNHLDVTGIIWLENFLRDSQMAFLMITHDRLFLQRTVDRIVDLDPRNPNSLLDITGSYAEYIEAKDLELAALKRQEKVQRNNLRREVEWLRRGALARQTKQSARIKSAGELAENVEALKAKNREQVSGIEFGKTTHSPFKLIEVRDVSKSYEGRTLFRNVDLLVTPKTRLALLGENGSGKSTLIKVILGEVTPDTGKVRLADKLQVAYFEQTRDTLDRQKSVLKNICPEGDYVNFRGQYVHVRSYLDRFLFFGNKADLAVEKLSGGEQARLRLAQLMLQPAQVLVLDEPTNDLDAETLEVLETALTDFNGAVILVTHDRYFMDAVSNQILAFPPANFPSRELHSFASYFQWEEWYRIESEKVAKAASAASSLAASSTAKQKAAPQKLSFKEKFELENMESTILDLESKISELNNLIVSPEYISDHQKLMEAHSKLASLQAELDHKYQRWSELEAKIKPT